MKPRLVYLEELIRIPILRTAEMSPDLLASATAHPPPLPRPPHLLSSSLCPSLQCALPMRTDFTLFRDPLVQFERQRAAQLIKEAVLTWRKRSDIAPQDSLEEYGRWLGQFLERECEQMEREMEGCRERWSSREWLYGEYLTQLTNEQMQMSQDAYEELKSCATMHPLIKREVMQHVCSVLSRCRAEDLKHDEDGKE